METEKQTTKSVIQKLINQGLSDAEISASPTLSEVKIGTVKWYLNKLKIQPNETNK